MKTSFFRWVLERGDFDATLGELYGAAGAADQRGRYISALDAHSARFGEGRIDNEISVFSVPGRSEICGNHTDHNGGMVIGCAVDVDLIAIASVCPEESITILSAGFGEDRVELSELSASEEEKFTSQALIRGVCAGFQKRGLRTGGFNAYITNNIKKGSGLSSSAAFEAAVGTVLSFLYNGGAVDPVEIAKISQEAEREYFGKACGLMDQAICSVGGLVGIDFEKTDAPMIKRLDADFSQFGYSMCITDTGGDHSDLSGDYSAVPAEMKAVAAFFGMNQLRGITVEQITENIPGLRRKCGDRAVLRALHFADENGRVERAELSLRKGDIEGFLRTVSESGRSSELLLQNIYPPAHPEREGIMLALAVTERLLSGQRAAWRVHGGGFAGTIQTFLPECAAEEYRAAMNRIFGDGACTVMHVRSQGATRLA